MTRFTFAEMADSLAALAWSKRTWIKDHGPKRSTIDVEQREREAEVLERAASDYRRASEREVNHA